MIDKEKIKYMGVLNQTDLATELRTCDILVEHRGISCDYTKYSYPSKINFYLSLGRIIVCTNLIGIPDEVKSQMVIIEDNNPENLVLGIKKAIDILLRNKESSQLQAKHYADNKFL